MVIAGRRRDSKAPSREHVLSPLRMARASIPATLQQVCEDLDKLSVDGSSGVTPGMLSGWELGRHITSIKYRRVLAEYYSRPPEELFAHQDQQLTATSETPQLLIGHHIRLRCPVRNQSGGTAHRPHTPVLRRSPQGRD